MVPHVLKVHDRTRVLLPTRAPVFRVDPDVLRDIARGVLCVWVGNERRRGRANRHLESFVRPAGALHELGVRKGSAHTQREVVRELCDQVHDERRGFGRDRRWEFTQLSITTRELLCNLTEKSRETNNSFAWVT